MSPFGRAKKEAHERPVSLEPDQFLPLLAEVGKEDFVLVDVREEYEFKKSHFQGAVNISAWEIDRRWKELDKEKRIALYCRSGHRSSRAAKVLSSAGFTHLFLLRGGLQAWCRYIQAVEKRSHSSP